MKSPEDQLMLFPEASLARTSPLPARAPASRASGPGYGVISPDLLARFDLDTRSWRTSQLSFLETTADGLAEFSETWPRSGIARSGIAYRLPVLEPLTGGIGSGLLPTPSAQESQPAPEMIEEMRAAQDQTHERLYLPGRKWHSQRTLSRIVHTWEEFPTPTAHDHKGRGAGSYNRHKGLDNHVKLWPTPRGPKYGADPKKLIREKRNHPSDLESAVTLWPTPMASTNRKSGKAMEPSTNNGRRSGGGNSSPPGLEQAVELVEGQRPPEMSDKAFEKYRKLWPTPKAADSNPAGAPAMLRYNEKTGRRTLMTEVQKWPTPTAGDSKASGSRNTEQSKAHAGMSLTDAVRGDGGKGRMWPTPTKNANQDCPSERRRNTPALASAVKVWPTPAAHEGRLGYQDRTLGKKGSQESLCTKVIDEEGGRRATSGQLNPTWVEWLMGFPLEWTDLNVSGTQSSPTSPSS